MPFRPQAHGAEEAPTSAADQSPCASPARDQFYSLVRWRTRLCRGSGVTDRLLTTREAAEDRVGRVACQIAARLYPGVRWEPLPGERPRLEPVAPSGEVERRIVGPDDVDAVIDGEVPASAASLADEDGLDTAA